MKNQVLRDTNHGEHRDHALESICKSVLNFECHYASKFLKEIINKQILLKQILFIIAGCCDQLFNKLIL